MAPPVPASPGASQEVEVLLHVEIPLLQSSTVVRFRVFKDKAVEQVVEAIGDLSLSLQESAGKDSDHGEPVGHEAIEAMRDRAAQHLRQMQEKIREAEDMKVKGDRAVTILQTMRSDFFRQIDLYRRQIEAMKPDHEVSTFNPSTYYEENHEQQLKDLKAKVAAAEATAEKAKKEHEEMKDELQFVRSTLLRKTKMLGQMMGEDKVPEFQERHAQTVAATTSEVGSQCVLAAVHAPRHSSADDDASSEDASAEGEAVAEAEAEGEAGITRRGRRSKTVGTLGGGDRRGAGDEGPGEGSEEGSGEGERAPSKRKDARSATWHSTTLGGKAVPKGMPVRRAPPPSHNASITFVSEGGTSEPDLEAHVDDDEEVAATERRRALDSIAQSLAGQEARSMSKMPTDVERNGPGLLMSQDRTNRKTTTWGSRNPSKLDATDEPARRGIMSLIASTTDDVGDGPPATRGWPSRPESISPQIEHDPRGASIEEGAASHRQGSRYLVNDLVNAGEVPIPFPRAPAARADALPVLSRRARRSQSLKFNEKGQALSASDPGSDCLQSLVVTNFKASGAEPGDGQAAGAGGGSEVGNLYNDPLAATYAFVRRRVTSGRSTFDRRRHTFQVGFADSINLPADLLDEAESGRLASPEGARKLVSAEEPRRLQSAPGSPGSGGSSSARSPTVSPDASRVVSKVVSRTRTPRHLDGPPQELPPALAVALAEEAAEKRLQAKGITREKLSSVPDIVRFARGS